jgi:hypothetical protein
LVNGDRKQCLRRILQGLATAGIMECLEGRFGETHGNWRCFMTLLSYELANLGPREEGWLDRCGWLYFFLLVAVVAEPDGLPVVDPTAGGDYHRDIDPIIGNKLPRGYDGSNTPHTIGNKQDSLRIIQSVGCRTEPDSN